MKKSEHKKLTVGIIEDNIAYRTALKNLIEENEEFDTPLVYGSFEQVLIADESQGTIPDVYLTDIGLPGISGIEGVRVFKAKYPQVQFIMITIHDDDNSVFDALCAGASGYLLKDAKPEVVISSIKEVVNGGSPMNMFVARKVIEMFKNFSQPKNEYGLTPREKEILELLIKGLNKNQISEQLSLSFHTVNTHARNIYEKLQVNTRSALVYKAMKERLM